ncbi:MAG TPA: sigma factor [Phycisphaerae bacterium]|nr:sigma factor [Phycisphaerae bacterium]
MPATPASSASSDFAVTRWTLVLAAARRDPAPEAAAALEQLARAYWYPLYAYVRRRGYSAGDAEDLTQGFFAHLLEHHALAHVTRSRGRFRAFLLTAMKHFLINAHHRAAARKRGDKRRVPLSPDAETRYAHEPADTVTPERLFDRRWALLLLEEALADVAREYAARRETALFNALKCTLTADDGPSRGTIAGMLGMSEGALKTAAHRLRRRYREAIRRRIAATVADPAEIDEEIRHLFSIL